MRCREDRARQGRLTAGLTLARAEQKEAALSYRATVLNDIVALYRALGGGWEKTVPKLPNQDVSTTPAADNNRR